jgi:uncharacterized protein (TIGR02117 family)
MPRRRHKSRARGRRRGRRYWLRQILLGLAVLPALYFLSALVGSLVPVNPGWDEPDEGITIYLANNGVHADIIMPASVQGLEWEPLVPRRHFAAPDPTAQWVAFGSGEEQVYLETPRWRDITLDTIWSGLTGGKRVMHVEWVSDLSYADREIRLRPEEYRRLWAAIRADFEQGRDGKPVRIDHSGYGCCDAFYWATGQANMVYTCNVWAANRLRIAGVETSLWPPFVQGLVWRYRKIGQST